MTKLSTDAASIIVPAWTAQPRLATAYRPTSGVSGAEIVVPAITPAAPKPTIKPLSAKTSSGKWPASAATVAAIKADIGATGLDAKKDVTAHILSASCIDRGIDAGTHIRALGVTLGFDGRHIGALLHAKDAAWRKGPDGRYAMLEL